jgi:hypothetical protein
MAGAQATATELTPPPQGVDVLTTGWNCDTWVRKLGLNPDSGKYWVASFRNGRFLERLKSLKGKRVHAMNLAIEKRYVPEEKNYSKHWTTFTSVYNPKKHMAEPPIVGSWYAYEHKTPMLLKEEPTPAYEEGTSLGFKTADGKRYELFRTSESVDVEGMLIDIADLQIFIRKQDNQIEAIPLSSIGSDFRLLIQVTD